MALILNIDTSTEQAGICLAREEHILGILRNDLQKDHAAWLHRAIEQLFENTGFRLDQLDAIANASGPGSYTGLRVGMAASKGLCFALQIPLITESTLKVMARAASEQVSREGPLLFCPMIDARRMEVFTAIYDSDLQELMPASALVLEPQAFDAWLDAKPIFFTGSGTIKWKSLCHHENAQFMELPFLAPHLARLAYEKYSKQEFSDILYAEPAYLKEFHTHIKK